MTVLGQKSLHLTTCLLLGFGLVLSFTQSLEEEKIAGKSEATLRQQAWTQEVFSGNLMATRGSAQDIFNFEEEDAVMTRAKTDLTKGMLRASASQNTYIQISHPPKGANINLPDNRIDMANLTSLENTVSVNQATKSDRRRAWRWEPFKVQHGRKEIAMNWSGSVWSMDGPFTEESNDVLPKLVFAPSENLELVMADAQSFLLPEAISDVPEILFAENESENERVLPADRMTTGSTNAMAYAATSMSDMEEPFKAILTEQRSGRISEENRVTVLGAVQDLKNGQDSSEDVVTLAALPKARATFTPAEPQEMQVRVSKPLDISPIVADAKPHIAEEPAQEPEPKNLSLTMAKSLERRAELQLASASSEGEDKEPKKSRWASWFNFSSTKKAKINTKGEHAWVTNTVPKSSFTKEQKTCLANAIYFESRSEPEDGQIAVGQVVMNRVKNPAYPNTICGVVYQNKSMRNACQFSFACDGIPDRVRSKKAWDLAWELAEKVVEEEVWLKSVGSATHYHATYVRPKWAKTMEKREKIGLHIFYRTYGGGWS